jgi:hypothetical protein
MTKLALAAARAGLALLFLSGVARANGRFPQSGQIAIDPVDPAHIAIRTTYGIVQSTDAGRTWRWICEPAAYPGGYDPALLVTGDGSLLVASAGLSRSSDRGCAWTRADAPMKGQFVTDLARGGTSPAHAIASVIPLDQFDGFRGVFAETFDNGASWQAKGALPPDFRALTVELAPSTASTGSPRIYAAGLGGNPLLGQFARSDDGGATWSIANVGSSDGTPWVSAVDPNDADVVYLRVDSFPSDRLLVSRNGGGTWTEAFVSKGDLLGFARSPDGSRIALGGPDDGLLVASATDLVFHPVNPLGVACLTWASSGLYVCADVLTAPYSAGVSTDEGVTVRPLFLAKDLEPLACSAASTSGSLCPPLWPPIEATIRPDAGVAGDAGPGTADTGALEGGASAGGGRFETRGGCSCVAVGANGAPERDTPWLALGCVACLVLAGKRRKAPRPTPRGTTSAGDVRARDGRATG